MKTRVPLLLLPLLLIGTALAQDPPVQRGGADPSDDAFRYGSPPALPEGTTEEEMWPAATAEQWRQPCLVRWQRSFDDAMAVARARNMPVLVAVNMDGEIASEHFAGVRYREPETARVLARYVCVIASVYRHTPRDHDPSGARVECPRFGTVTCGEHIQAERELYGRYFDGRRISPRHIVLDHEGRETFDVYYSWDTATVFTAYAAGLEGWPEPLGRPEPTPANLARSRDVADRQRLEALYREGDRDARRAILLSLQEPDAADQVEVLRAAVFGFDPELARLARGALVVCETDGALDLMAEALQVPLENAERERLLEAVRGLGETLPRARTLAALHDGLHLEARDLAPEPDAAAAYEQSARGLDERADAVAARPTEPGALLDLAEGLVQRAGEADPRYRELFLRDAHDCVREAARLGGEGARLDAIWAAVLWEDGQRRMARERAVAAVDAGLLDGDGGAADLPPAVRRRVLELFGAERQRRIRDAYRAGEGWDPAWLADAVSAYAALAREEDVDERTLLEHHDFLRWIGAAPQAGEVLERTLARFPDSPAAHERLRERLLWEGGPEALERGYAERVAAREGELGTLDWFAGYASLVAAEHHRRRGRFDEAQQAYARAIATFEARAARAPEVADDADHYVALALAGRARVAMELADLDGAARELLAALARRPASAAALDGLGITPVATARMLQTRLTQAGDADGAARVAAALEALDPALLEPPPTELRGSRGRRGG